MNLFGQIAHSLVVTAAAGLFAIGCSGDTAKETSSSATNAAAGAAKAETAGGAAAAKVGNPGSIVGRVTFKGTPPRPRQINMSADPYCAKVNPDGATRINVAVGAGGGLAGVFVYVKSGVTGRYPTPGEKIVLDQRNCNYAPSIVGAMVGQGIEIRNSDSTLHNVHALPTKSRPFNMGMPTAGMKSTRKFTSPEVLVRIKCDVHPWMETFVGVTEHPFFAVTGADGSFAVNGLAPGEYVFAAVHPKLGSREASVTVAPGGETSAAFEFEKKG